MTAILTKRAGNRRSAGSRRALAALLSCCLVAGAAPAAAQSKGGEASAADALFQEARKLIADGNYAAACPKLEESLRLDPAPGTRLNLADCYEHIGRTATAWTIFNELATATQVAGLRDKERLARDRATALEPKLSKIVIEVPAATAALPGLVVRRDGETVEPGAWGTARPVDPGPHQLEASAPGSAPWAETIEVSVPGKTYTARVLIEGPPDTAPPPAPVPSGSRDLGVQRVAGIALGGAGVAGILVGVIFGLRASSKHSEAQDEHCPTPTRCDQRGVDLTAEAQSAATVSTIAFLAGGVVAAGGAVLYFTSPDRSTQASLSVAPLGSGVAGLGGGELRLGGRW